MTDEDETMDFTPEYIGERPFKTLCIDEYVRGMQRAAEICQKLYADGAFEDDVLEDARVAILAEADNLKKVLQRA
jgi:hypothetical protein